MSVALPPQVHVFVRDWLSANNVVLKAGDGCVVVDSGYVKHVPLTLALVASRMGLDGRPLSKLVNTHCHSDHMGGNAALKRAYACPIAVPAGEAR
ncbi:MAG: MBL fold metallo-hydrolase, partial [Casimicrobiaceae bacterium]